MSESKSLKECLEDYANATFAQIPASGSLEIKEDFGEITVKFIAEHGNPAGNTKFDMLSNRLTGYNIPFTLEQSKHVPPTLTIQTFSETTVQALNALGKMSILMKHRDTGSTKVQVPVYEQRRIKKHGRGEDSDRIDGIDI